MQKKIVLQYYVLSGLLSFGGLSFVSAIYASFLLRNGLNLMQINMINAAFYVGLIACELPTGAFADLFGRKKAFGLACLLIGVAKLIYSLSTGWVGFVIAELVAALGVTFQSGAFQAWFIDSMKHHGYIGDPRKYISNKTLISQICAACGAMTGGYLFTIDITLPWTVGALMLFALTAYVLVVMREDYFEQTSFTASHGLRRMIDIGKKSIEYSRTNKAVRFVLMVTFIQILAVQALNMYWQPFFAQKGLNERYYGVLFASMIFFLAIGSFIAGRLKIVGDEKMAIIVSQFASGGLIVIAVLMPNMASAIILFAMHELPRGLLEPLKETYLQKNIPSAERATISSFCSMAPHIGGIIGLAASGVIAQIWGISAAWMFSGMIFIVGSMLIVVSQKR